MEGGMICTQCREQDHEHCAGGCCCQHRTVQPEPATGPPGE